MISYLCSSTSQVSYTECLDNPAYGRSVDPIANIEPPEAEAAYSYAVIPQTQKNVMPQNHEYDVVTNVTEERPRVNQDIFINNDIYSVAENV